MITHQVLDEQITDMTINWSNTILIYFQGSWKGQNYNYSHTA